MPWRMEDTTCPLRTPGCPMASCPYGTGPIECPAQPCKLLVAGHAGGLWAFLAFTVALALPAAEGRALLGITEVSRSADGFAEEDPCPFEKFVTDPFPDWQQAAQEEGLDLARISTFGRTIPKFARSEVNKLLKLNFTKVRNYSFMGRLGYMQPDCGPDYMGRRAWVSRFARQNFSADDVLYVTDAPSNWTLMGAFDHSNLEPMQFMTYLNSSGVDRATIPWAVLDWNYEMVTAASRFSLCPGGHGPWSYRIVEAFAMKALPLISERDLDWNIKSTPVPYGDAIQAVLELMRHVAVQDLPVVGYRQEWVDENFRNFIRYFTFMEGDNVPPGLKNCHGVLPNGTVWHGMMLSVARRRNPYS